MSPSERQDHPPTGLLYVNLGSPSAPTPAAVGAFLDEFLGDPMLVDMNPVLWWFLRKLVVLPRRSRSSAKLYASVWTDEGSPLVVHSHRFARALARELGEEFEVAVAMRYGEPSIAHGLEELVRKGCRRVVLFSAFPQESRATSGTIELEVRRVLAGIPNPPQLLVQPPYFADPGYVSALAQRVRDAGISDALQVFSFHGLPVRFVEAGDPYRDHCEATARALAAELGLASGDWTLAYQSRFGREPWLEPDVAQVVPALAAQGRRMVLSSPSFTTDCLETLEELGLRLREAVVAAGGSELVLVPCLNEHPAWVRAAARLVRVTVPSQSKIRRPSGLP